VALIRSASMSSATAASEDPSRAWTMSYFKDALGPTAGPTTVCAGRHIELDLTFTISRCWEGPRTPSGGRPTRVRSARGARQHWTRLVHPKGALMTETGTFNVRILRRLKHIGESLVQNQGCPRLRFLPLDTAFNISSAKASTLPRRT
jgi:hypothetical protein